MWKKVVTIGGSLLFVSSLVFAGFVFEDRYNNQIDHNKDLVSERSITDLQFENIEKQVVMNLKQFQKEQQLSSESQRRENDYRYYSNLIENINNQIYKLRQWIRQHPDDLEAKEDYSNLQKKRDLVKQKLDELMTTN
jgi:hypothetical protein